LISKFGVVKKLPPNGISLIQSPRGNNVCTKNSLNLPVRTGLYKHQHA
jgi:hypothetical protein